MCSELGVMRESSAEKELFRFNSDELSRKELEKFGRSHCEHIQTHDELASSELHISLWIRQHLV